MVPEVDRWEFPSVSDFQFFVPRGWPSIRFSLTVLALHLQGNVAMESCSPLERRTESLRDTMRMWDHILNTLHISATGSGTIRVNTERCTITRGREMEQTMSFEKGKKKEHKILHLGFSLLVQPSEVMPPVFCILQSPQLLIDLQRARTLRSCVFKLTL